MSKIKKEILEETYRKARKKIEKRKARRYMIGVCLGAGLCPSCGKEITPKMTRISCIFGSEYKCLNCGFYDIVLL